MNNGDRLKKFLLSQPPEVRQVEKEAAKRAAIGLARFLTTRNLSLAALIGGTGYGAYHYRYGKFGGHIRAGSNKFDFGVEGRKSDKNSNNHEFARAYMRLRRPKSFATGAYVKSHKDGIQSTRSSIYFRSKPFSYQIGAKGRQSK